MTIRTDPKLPRQSLSQGMALVCLLVLGGLALLGPSGLLAWSENQRLLEQRRQEIKTLAAERDLLRNRVALLNPRDTDADLAGELLRKDLNVVHPDEVMLLLN
jgi:cell division protein FtsB